MKVPVSMLMSTQERVTFSVKSVMRRKTVEVEEKLSKESIDSFAKLVVKSGNQELVEEFQKLFQDKAIHQRQLWQLIDIALDNKQFDICAELSKTIQSSYDSRDLCMCNACMTRRGEEDVPSEVSDR